MKVLSITLLISLFFTFLARSQQNKLPDEIEKYYHGRNFINSFSLRDERQHIYTLLSKGEDLSHLKEERLLQVAVVMQELMEKTHPFLDHGNSLPSLPIQLLIPEINELTGWRMDENHILVNLYTYSIDNETNLKFIASYTPDMKPGEYIPIDLSSLKYQSQEVHEWFFDDDTWKKSSVNKILVE